MTVIKGQSFTQRRKLYLGSTSQFDLITRHLHTDI